MQELETENLRQLLQGTDLNNYQRALALKEYQGLIFYINKLENQVKNLSIPVVSESEYCKCKGHSKWREQGKCEECGKQI